MKATSIDYLRHLVFIGLAWFFANSAVAQQYRILYLNTEMVNIGGKNLKRGDVFDAHSLIFWKSDQQAIRVLNLADNKQLIIMAKKFKESSAKSLADYVVQRKSLSTRQGGARNLMELGHELNDTLFLLDKIVVEVPVSQNEHRFFYLSYRYYGETINKKLAAEDTTGSCSAFVIDRSIFTIDGEPISPFDTDISIYFMDADAGTSTLVSSSTYLVVL